MVLKTSWVCNEGLTTSLLTVSKFLPFLLILRDNQWIVAWQKYDKHENSSLELIKKHGLLALPNRRITQICKHKKHFIVLAKTTVLSDSPVPFKRFWVIQPLRSLCHLMWPPCVRSAWPESKGPAYSQIKPILENKAERKNDVEDYISSSTVVRSDKQTNSQSVQLRL